MYRPMYLSSSWRYTLARSGLTTPPTILQNAPVGAVNKRERTHPVHDSDRLLVHFYPFHQSTNDLPPCGPVSLLQPALDPVGKFPQLPDHQPQFLLLSVFLGLRLGF